MTDLIQDTLQKLKQVDYQRFVDRDELNRIAYDLCGVDPRVKIEWRITARPTIPPPSTHDVLERIMRRVRSLTPDELNDTHFVECVINECVPAGFGVEVAWNLLTGEPFITVRKDSV